MRKLAGVVLVLLLSGCLPEPNATPVDAGPFDAGTGNLSGALGFDVHESFEVHLVNQQDGTELGYGADLVDYDLTCGQLETGQKPGPFMQVEVGVLGSDGSTLPSPGTYPVVISPPTSGLAAYVKWARLLEDGGVFGPTVAQDGTVTLTAASDQHLAGSFQVNIADVNGQVGPLSGSFDSPFCP